MCGQQEGNQSENIQPEPSRHGLFERLKSKWHRLRASRFCQFTHKFIGEGLPPIKFILEQLWRWPVVTIVAVTIYGYGVNAMYGNDFRVAIICYTLAVAWLTAKVLTWETISQHKSRGFISIFVLLISSVILWISLAPVQRRWKSTQHFVATLDLTIVSRNSSLFTSFFVLDKQSNLLPINATLYVTLTNRQSVPAKIDGISIKMNCSPYRRWIHVYRIDTTDKLSYQVFMVSMYPNSTKMNLKNAKRIDYDDLSFIMASEVFSPGVPRGGMLFIQYPLDISCSSDPLFRLDLHDSLGSDSVMELPRDNAHPPIDWVNPWIHVRYIQTGVDISKFPFFHYR